MTNTTTITTVNTSIVEGSGEGIFSDFDNYAYLEGVLGADVVGFDVVAMVSDATVNGIPAEADDFWAWVSRYAI